jgi:hypothetical protein
MPGAGPFTSLRSVSSPGLGSMSVHYCARLGFIISWIMMAGYRPPSPAGEHHLLPPPPGRSIAGSCFCCRPGGPDQRLAGLHVCTRSGRARHRCRHQRLSQPGGFYPQTGTLYQDPGLCHYPYHRRLRRPGRAHCPDRCGFRLFSGNPLQALRPRPQDHDGRRHRRRCRQYLQGTPLQAPCLPRKCSIAIRNLNPR